MPHLDFTILESDNKSAIRREISHEHRCDSVILAFNQVSESGVSSLHPVIIGVLLVAADVHVTEAGADNKVDVVLAAEATGKLFTLGDVQQDYEFDLKLVDRDKSAEAALVPNHTSFV